MSATSNQKIAVVGIGSLFPDAKNTNEFWQNIIDKKVSIKELPDHLFEKEIYYRPELRKAFNKQDKSYTKIAGYIENLDFNTVRKFKIPPSVSEHMDPNQHAALYTADEALKNINLDNIAKDKVSVIYGNGSVGTRYGDAIVSVQYEKIKHYLRKHPLFSGVSEKEQEELFEYVRANALNESIPLTEDSAPGILPNIIAARVSNVFDFNGPSYTIDSACASALTAVIAGVKGLRLNEIDMAVCGGSDMPIKSLGLIFFSAINALSPDGSFPFDVRANGFVMGQGSGTVVLKRLEDAVRDNDNIYAIINGYGEASDGKGKYIAAPNSDWQAHSITKACEMAGYSVDTIELIEAHGTGTIVGDVVELDGLKKAFGKLGFSRKNYCGISSVKSNIGHLKSAAGIAGFIKATLSLKNKKLPATANLETINPKLELENSPFYILGATKDWQENPNFPRRANVSAFGFGGADYHLALEEYREDDYKSKNYSIASAKHEPVQKDLSEITQNKQDDLTTKTIFFSSDNLEDLYQTGVSVIEKVKNKFSSGSGDFIKFHNINSSTDKEFRLAILFDSTDELKEKLIFFKTNQSKLPKEVLNSKGIFFKSGKGVTKEQTAILFPGQAAQYANMLVEVKNSSDIFKNAMDKADAYWLSENGKTVSSLIYGDEKELNPILKETQNTHPAVFSTSIALFKYLKNLGLNAEYMVGHSLGEITALAASGMLTFENALKLVNARGSAFVDAKLPDNGKMLSVSLEQNVCDELIKKSKIKNVSVANINSTKQTIVAGSSEGIEKLASYLKGENVAAKEINVSHAFHTNLMEPVSNLFNERIEKLEFIAGTTKVLINHTGEFYPSSKKNLKKLSTTLAEQILQPVNFVRSIEKLKNDGVKLFVEIGPNSILSSLTKNILDDDEITILSSNYKKGNSLQALQKFQAALFAEGLKLDPINTSTQFSNSVIEQPIRDSETKVNVTSNNVSVVYSGVSIGLPGSYKEMFQDDNFTQIFEGRNFIERMTDEEKQNLVDLSVTKLVKDEKGPVFKLLSSLDDVIQLSGKSGKLDIVKDYHIDENEIKKITKTISMGIAAAYEALKDAKIPLVQEFTKTSSGKYLPGKLTLPKIMQNDTGVIFANGFPMVDPIIEEVSRHVAYKYGAKNISELINFYQSIIEKVKDEESKKLLSDWFSLHYSRLNNGLNGNDIFQFNYNFITQISSQANNRIAQLLNAKGPNFQMNAACASTSNAITIAEDFIKTGRVKRMIIIGADDATSKNNMPYLGAGFLSSGAATIEGDLYKAAVPFDVKRNGMIMSAGAVGIVLEDKTEVRSRGIIEVCELVGSHSFNTANHPSQIDSDGFSYELNRFISKVEQNKSLDRNKLASDLIYISHETYTPPRGGCSQTEAIALTDTFTTNAKDIIIGNTKGMTGHAMGAALEEAIAAKALQYGKVPPVVNLSQKDPLLSDLHISTGESHNKNYALRMSAGFGAQGNYILLKKVSDGENRISDKSKYQNWLKAISGNDNPTESLKGKILVVETDSTMVNKIKEPTVQQEVINQENKKVAEVPTKENIIDYLSKLTEYPQEMLEDEMEFTADLGIEGERLNELKKAIQGKYSLSNLTIKSESTIGDLLVSILNPNVSSGSIEQTPIETKNEVDSSKFDDEVKTEVLKIFSEVTKYPEDMLDLDMEMEADLGIDTVKQATILSMIGEKYQIERDDDLRLSDFPTIGHIIDLVYRSSNIALPEKVIETSYSSAAKINNSDSSISAQDEELKNDVLQVFSEVTKYPEDMLELDMEMEADLGIDTVKQATILSILGEKYMLEQNDDMRLSDFPTIGHIITLVKENGKAFAVEADSSEVAVESLPPSAPIINIGGNTNAQDEGLKNDVLQVFSEVTKYPEDMLELDMEMEADLGIDTVKQATILSILGEKYMLEQNDDIRLSDYPTIGHIITLVKENGKAFAEDVEYSEVMDEEENANENLRSVDPQANATELSRQTTILSPSKLVKKVYSIKNKNVLIIGNASKSVKLFKQHLDSIGSKVQTYIFPNTENIDELLKTFEKIKNPNAIDVIIDSTNILANSKKNKSSIGLTDSELFVNVKNRFLFFKSLLGENFSPDKIICLISDDGAFGLSSKNNNELNPINGAINGLYKSIRKELSTELKVIDFAPSLINSKFDFVNKAVVNELEKSGSGVEIGYTNATRKILKINDAVIDLKDEINFDENDVFLISGGANGITFEILKGIADKYKSRFVLIGRTSLPENVAELSELSDNQFEELRKDIRERLEKENDRVTPKMINDEYNQLKKSVTIYRNLKTIGEERSYYISADITNFEQLKTELSKLPAEFNNISALIHGSGIDKSNMLTKKSIDDFNLVFDTKVKGSINLEKIIDINNLKLAVGISSISGRFGNSAQTDYSAANNFISSWIRKLGKDNPKLKAFSFLTSGWKEVGMAWRNTFVREGSEELGLNLIEPALAVKAFINELENSSNGREILIHKGLNGFIEDDLSESKIEKYPLLDRIVKNGEDVEKAYRMFSVKRDAMLDQHRLGDTPIMPAVGYSEIGAEYLSQQTNLKNQFLFKQITFENPFKLFKEKAKELFVHGNEGASSNWEIEIQSKFTLANSDITNLVTHSKMEVTNNIGNYDDMNPDCWNLDVQNPVSLPASESLMLIEGQGPKQRIILGPLYNDIVRDTDNKAAVTIFDNSVVYPTNFPKEQLTNSKYPLDSLLVNPCFLDTLYQSCAAHLLVTRKRVYLPWLAEDLGIVQVPKEDGVYTCYGQLLEETDDIVKYRVTMLDENKNIRYFVRSIEFRKINL